MTFIPLVPKTDDRRDQAMSPLVIRNMMWEPLPKGGVKAADWALVNWPGLTRRYSGDVANKCRGLFSAPGVQDGVLFAVLGGALYSISDTYVVTNLGAIAGADNVQWGYLRENLLILGGGELYKWDGATLTQVSDSDFPANAYTLTMLDQRVIVTVNGEDQYYWSNVLDSTSWASLAFATSERRPDQIIASGTLGGDLWLFGSKGIEVLSGGGEASAPFSTLRSVDIFKGCASRDSLQLIQGSFFFLADDRSVYQTTGYGIQQIAYRPLERLLEVMTAQELSECVGFQVQFGSRLFYVLRLPDNAAFAYDIFGDTWTELKTWQQDNYKIAFCVSAYGKTFCAGPNQGDIFTYERDVWTDDSGIIERIFTLAVGVGQRLMIGNLGYDLSTYAVPLSGQGSSPKMMVEYWKDAGRYESGSSGVIVDVSLPAQGETRSNVAIRSLGLVNPKDGLILQHTVTDPIGLQVSGCRVNERLAA